jgi:hypothetical protein
VVWPVQECKSCSRLAQQLHYKLPRWVWELLRWQLLPLPLLLLLLLELLLWLWPGGNAITEAG